MSFAFIKPVKDLLNNQKNFKLEIMKRVDKAMSDEVTRVAKAHNTDLVNVINTFQRHKETISSKFQPKFDNLPVTQENFDPEKYSLRLFILNVELLSEVMKLTKLNLKQDVIDDMALINTCNMMTAIKGSGIF